MGCCSSEGRAPPRLACPACGNSAEGVSHTTLLHQLRNPLHTELCDAPYYFCATADCDTVYFNAAAEQFSRDALRQPVGQKSHQADHLLCYCFDIRYGEIADSKRARLCYDFVVQQTAAKRCACEQRNPSGKCCLRDFPRLEE